MENTKILEIAKGLADRLNIKIKNEPLILENMKSKTTPTTTILYNRDYILWIDRYYIAYSDNSKVDVRYAFITKHHIHEELREINKMLKNCSFTEFIMLTDILGQMHEAKNAMNLSGERHYISQDLVFRKPRVIKIMDSTMLITLCPACANQFFNSPELYIKRIDRNQLFKENCTYCTSNEGFDYELCRKKPNNTNMEEGKR